MGKQADEMRAAALEIVSLGKRVGEIHRLLDSYAANGSLPVEEKAAKLLDVSEMSRADLVRTLVNMPPNISRAKKRLAGLDPKSAEAKLLAENIAIWTAQLAAVRALAKES